MKNQTLCGYSGATPGPLRQIIVSIGTQKGPRIGMQKGPLGGVGASRGGTQPRFLKRQLSLPVSMISQ
jgi:hypothetical protein